MTLAYTFKFNPLSPKPLEGHLLELIDHEGYLFIGAMSFPGSAIKTFSDVHAEYVKPKLGLA